MAELIDPLTDPARGSTPGSRRSSTWSDTWRLSEEQTMSRRERQRIRPTPTDRIRWATTELAVEIPSWGFVNTGTRFRVFPQAGRAAGRLREGRGRGHGRALHGDREDGRAAHPVGHGRRLRRRWRRSRRSAGSASAGINSNTFQDEDYKLGSLLPPVGGGAAQGDRRHRRLLRDRPADRVGHREGLALGRHQLSRPGRLPGAPPAADRLAHGGLRGPPRQRPDGPRVQALRAGLLPHRRAGLGPVAVGLPAPRRARPGLRRHRPPRDGREHRADRRRSCSRRAGSAPST